MVKFLAYFCLIMIVAHSCKKADERSCAKFNGEISSKTLPISGVSDLTIYDDISIVLINDSINIIEVIGHENILPFIDFVESQNKLVISNKNKCDFLRYRKPITLKLHYTKMDTIHLNGYGQLTNTGQLTHNLNIKSHESFYKVTLSLNNDSTIISAQVGSVETDLSGTTDYLYVYSNGASKIDASKLTCKEAHGHSQGIGDFHLSAIHKITVELRSKGNFYLYNTENAFKNIITTGEGTVHYL